MPNDKTTKALETSAPDTGPAKPLEQAPVKEPVKTESLTPEQKSSEQAADKAAPPKDKIAAQRLEVGVEQVVKMLIASPQMVMQDPEHAEGTSISATTG